MTPIARHTARGALAAVLAFGAAGAAPAAASDVWRFEPTRAGGLARSCTWEGGERVCAVVACTPRGRLALGVAGWEPRGRGDRRDGWIGIDGRGPDVTFRRVGGRSLWRAQTGGATRRLIRRIKEGYSLEIDIAARGPAYRFTLDNSYRAISRVERRCDGGREYTGAPVERWLGPEELFAGAAGLFLGEVLGALDDGGPGRDGYRRDYRGDDGPGRHRGRGPDRTDRGDWDDRDRGRHAGRDRGWDRIALTRVDRQRDRDVIEIGPRAGRFDALRLEARGNIVALKRIVVRYGNGAEQEIRVGQRLDRDDATRDIALGGRRGRVIEQVTLHYRTVGQGPRAKVALWGRQAG